LWQAYKIRFGQEPPVINDIGPDTFDEKNTQPFMVTRDAVALVLFWFEANFHMVAHTQLGVFRGEQPLAIMQGKPPLRFDDNLLALFQTSKRLSVLFGVRVCAGGRLRFGPESPAPGVGRDRTAGASLRGVSAL
jgi:hypothetical protein